MTTGWSLHIGLNAVSKDHYAGWGGELEACEADARAMSGIASSQGLVGQLILTTEATRGAVTSAIKRAAAELREGDLFVLTYAGHGGQVPDTTGEETDGLDETWCLYDGQLLDDEVFGLLATFRAGVRVVVVSDSCHSGSITREIAWRGGVARFMPAVIAQKTYQQNKAFYLQLRAVAASRAGIAAAVITLAACKDDQLSLDGPTNGFFTGRLLDVWKGAKTPLSYTALHQAILPLMPQDETPILTGEGVGYEALFNEAAFALTTQATQAPLSGVTQAVSTSSAEEHLKMSDQWENVQAELSRRLADGGAQPLDADKLAALNSLLAQRGLFGPLAAGSAAAGEIRGSRGGTVVRALWWGLQIEISHADLQAFLASADPINAFIGSVGSAIPSPAAPFIALAAAFVAGALGLLRGLDRGNGVYVSMTWFAPGVFIPTTVPTRDATASLPTASRDAGQIVELVSDRFGFGPNWREDRLIDIVLPTGSVRDGEATVYASPGSNGQAYFVRWYNPDDPRDGRFYLHVGSPFFGGGGTCIWILNGHYEVLNPFPRAASTARAASAVRSDPRVNSGVTPALARLNGN